MSRSLQLEDGALSLALLASVALVSWSWFDFSSSRNGLKAAQSQLGESRDLASSIQELRTTRSVASTTGTESPLTNSAVAEMLKSAGINETKLFNVARFQSPIPETEYIRDDVTLSLRGISMVDLCTLLSVIEASGNGVTATVVSFSWSSENSADSSQAELWDTQLVLTHLIFHAKRRE